MASKTDMKPTGPETACANIVIMKDITINGRRGMRQLFVNEDSVIHEMNEKIE